MAEAKFVRMTWQRLQLERSKVRCLSLCLAADSEIDVMACVNAF